MINVSKFNPIKILKNLVLAIFGYNSLNVIFIDFSEKKIDTASYSSPEELGEVGQFDLWKSLAL